MSDGEYSNSGEEILSYNSDADPRWVPHQEFSIINYIITISVRSDDDSECQVATTTLIHQLRRNKRRVLNVHIDGKRRIFLLCEKIEHFLKRTLNF